MKFYGYRKADFTAKDGTKVTGYNVYIGDDIDPAHGGGLAVERYYLSTTKLERNNIDIKELLECDVHVYFNQYGKVENVVLAD